MLITVDSVPRQSFMDNKFLFGNCFDNLMISYNIVDITCGIKGYEENLARGIFVLTLNH